MKQLKIFDKSTLQLYVEVQSKQVKVCQESDDNETSFNTGNPLSSYGQINEKVASEC